jgi:hypothetical protein
MNQIKKLHSSFSAKITKNSEIARTIRWKPERVVEDWTERKTNGEREEKSSYQLSLLENAESE